MKTKITCLNIMGDSLSDTGTLNEEFLVGVVPMSFLSGLSGKSPRGRFTNGFLWADFVAASLIGQLLTDRARKKSLLAQPDNDNTELPKQENAERKKLRAQINADLGDQIISNENRLRSQNEEAFTLDDNKQVLFEGHRFARYFCEGGLTSHTYTDDIILDPSKQVSRLILSNLESKRKLLLDDDKRYEDSLKKQLDREFKKRGKQLYHSHKEKLNALIAREKRETLTIELSGANDLITVNEKPTLEAVDLAVKARIKNIKQLIENGYTNFVLFNLPDLSLTPRFQRASEEERENARECSEHFNKLLADKCAALNDKYKNRKYPASVNVFDINALFQKVYDNPEEYGFDKNKLKSPFIESEEYKNNKNNPDNQKNHTSPSTGFMFWDNVHPTADMHAIWGAEFEKEFGKTHRLESPASNNDFKFEPRDLRFFDTLNLDRPKSTAAPLPEDVSQVLKKIKRHTNSIIQNSKKHPDNIKHEIRLQKAEILTQLVSEIYNHYGDLQEIRATLARLKNSDDKLAIIKTHQHPLRDRLFWKRKTYSEEKIDVLLDRVNYHIQKKDLFKQQSKAL